MYKIYINETPIHLLPISAFSEGNDLNLSLIYSGRKRNLFQYIDTLEKTNNYESIRLHAPDPEQLATDFFSLFKVVEAGGGVVENENGKILAIYRRGFWDLPKGKLDPGETSEQASVREVEEETGISGIVRGSFLRRTYHTFRGVEGKRILKATTWYKMEAPDQETLPQKEEDIEKAVFMDARALLETTEPIYENIKDVLEVFLSKK